MEPKRNFEKVSISKKTMKKLKELSRKEGKKLDDLIETLIEERKGKSSNSEQRFRQKGKGTGRSGKNMEINVDLSKFVQPNLSEFIQLIKRITNSLENIEQSHAKGWKDQRIDLGALSERLDKIM